MRVKIFILALLVGVCGRLSAAQQEPVEPAAVEVASAPVVVASPVVAAPPVVASTDTSKGLTPAQRLEAEWNYLKDGALDPTDGAPAAAADELAAFIDRHPDAPMMDEAQALLASLYKKQGDAKSSMICLLRLIYEYPQSKAALKAQSELLELGDKTLSRKLRPALGELVKGSDAADKADRLAAMLQRVVEGLGDALYDPTVREIRRFQARFPDYSKSDVLDWTLAQLHEKNEKYAAALSADRQLIAVYPESAYKSSAQFAIGGIYADDLRNYRKALDAYQQFVDQYPDNVNVLPALQRMAQLFSDKFKQYELAVQIDERIIKTFPKTEGALKAFNDEAKLLRDRLAKPDEAIKTYRRLTKQFAAPPAVTALQEAAMVARKDLKDFKLEIELRSQIAADYAFSHDAPAELYAAAEVYEDDLKDLAGALKTYKEVSAKFPNSKQSRKAADRLAKLEKGKS